MVFLSIFYHRHDHATVTRIGVLGRTAITELGIVQGYRLGITRQKHLCGFWQAHQLSQMLNYMNRYPTANRGVRSR
ncbi:hypothetical protein D3C75_744560 [compost metagenome]